VTVYRWSDGDDTATDAVIVGIACDSFEPEAAASIAGPILASVYWPQRLFQGDRVQARMEGPFEPAVALSYAEEIAKLYQFPRVVVAIQARTLWNDAWGTLAPHEGFD
jgi:hypothetical protein